MPLIVLLFIFAIGLSVGALLMAHRHHIELEELKSQARDYRMQALALKNLCQRLERVSQLPPSKLSGLWLRWPKEDLPPAAALPSTWHSLENNDDDHELSESVFELRRHTG